MGNLLDGKVALVTGGTRGIGRAIAEAFHAEGAAVALSGRSEDKGRAALEEMGGGDRLFFQAGDARRKADVDSLIDATVAAFGPIDILVNNAGGSSGFALAGDLSDEAWQESADWILNSTFWATRRVLNPMKERGFGRIINISSLESKYLKTPMASHYATFKAAVNTFGRAVAVEYGQFGITANAICPGAIETDLMNVLRAVHRPLRQPDPHREDQHRRGGGGGRPAAGRAGGRRDHRHRHQRRRRHVALVAERPDRARPPHPHAFSDDATRPVVIPPSTTYSAPVQ
jgi:3-hydroxybutyrate dehydrogenase/3-oxoacyl-[acyl-carrier protein] reductase